LSTLTALPNPRRMSPTPIDGQGWPGGVFYRLTAHRPGGSDLRAVSAFGAAMTTGDWLALVGIILGCWAALARWMLQITRALARLEEIADDMRGIKKMVDRNTRDISTARERIGVLESLVKD